MLRRFEDYSGFAATRFNYEINHAAIIEKDHLPFLEFWNVSRIAKAGSIRRMFGNVNFFISGFDHDNRAIYEIPEIRIYLKELAAAWPYFFWSDCLDTGFLPSLMQCMVSNLTVVSSDSSPIRNVSAMSVSDANAVYRKLADGFVEVCKLDPTMNQTVFDARIADVQAHLKKTLKSQ